MNKIKYHIIFGIITIISMIVVISIVLILHGNSKHVNINDNPPNKKVDSFRDCLKTCFDTEENKKHPDECIIDKCIFDNCGLGEHEFFEQLNNKNKEFYMCLIKNQHNLSYWEKCLNG